MNSDIEKAFEKWKEENCAKTNCPDDCCGVCKLLFKAGDTNGYERGFNEAIEKAREWIKNHYTIKNAVIENHNTIYNFNTWYIDYNDLLAELDKLKGE